VSFDLPDGVFRPPRKILSLVFCGCRLALPGLFGSSWYFQAVLKSAGFPAFWLFCAFLVFLNPLKSA
jgi:hypothetical protein